MSVMEAGGKVASGFMESMKQQPLSLALVVMNLALIGFLFYSGVSVATQRKETVDLIVSWQKETDRLMANCVSADVTRLMLENMQKITETMLKDREKQASRLQSVIESLSKQLYGDQPKPQSGGKSIFFKLAPPRLMSLPKLPDLP